MTVSTLLLTLNEEGNLSRCLESLAWCDDIVVMDSFSSDRTVEVAKSAGARVYQRKFDDFAGQRNHALDEVAFEHEWILHLDADEVCTEQLRGEIEQRISDPQYDAYRIPSKMIFMGKWLRFSGMYPCYQVRLGRHPAFRFKQVGHGQREDVEASKVGTLTSPYTHHSFSKGITDWIERHNRYSCAEALERVRNENTVGLDLAGLFARRDTTRRRRALKALSYHLPCRPLLRFLYMYALRRGFLDGVAGYRYCRMLAMYEMMTDLKLNELRRGQDDRQTSSSLRVNRLATNEDGSRSRCDKRKAG